MMRILQRGGTTESTLGTKTLGEFGYQYRGICCLRGGVITELALWEICPCSKTSRAFAFPM